MTLYSGVNSSRILAVLAMVALGPACGGSTTQNGGGSAGGSAGAGGSGGSVGTGGGGSAGTGGGAGAGSGGSAVTGGGAGSGGSAGAGGSAGTGGAGACDPACGEARQCCDGACVNPANDPKNCGGCGKTCGADTYCTGGACVVPPCTATCASGTTCCGGECCAGDDLCCDPQGPIDMAPRCLAPSDQGTCPQGCAPLCICASPDTPIATPNGERPIASLKVGDLVYSVEGAAVTAVPIVATRRTPVSHHHVVRVSLANGSVLEISAGHPTADGRTIGELVAGGELDHVAVTDRRVVPYAHPYTYDILPDSESGAYFAGGVLLGSTLAPRASRACTELP